MKKFFLAVAALLVVLIFYFVFFKINREDLTFKSKYELITGKQIKDNHTDIVVIITSSGCPESKTTIPVLKKNIEKLNKEKIKYIIVSDELYSKKVDEKLDNFVRKYSLNEKVYLMDIAKYPNNSGIFNSKRRYREFMTDLCDLCAQTPLGYVNYIIIHEGVFVKALPYMDETEIAKLKV